MKSLEEFLEEMEKNLSAMGMPIEKAKLKNYLLKPGVERLNLVQWALSQIGVVVKDEKDVPMIICEFGICVSANVCSGKCILFLFCPHNNLRYDTLRSCMLSVYKKDSCSDVDSIKFWKKLFGIVHAYKEVNQEAVRNSYKKNEKFCLNLSSSSTLKQILQPTNTNTKIPLQVQRCSDKIVSREELMKLHLDVCNELKELDQEKEQWQKEGDVALQTNYSPSKISGEVEKLKVLASRFQQSSSWMSSKVDNSSGTEHEKLRKLIMDLNERVEKVNLYCKDTKKVLEAIDTIRNSTYEESNDTTMLQIVDGF